MKTLLSLFQLLPAIIQAILALKPLDIAGLSKKQIILHVIDVVAQLGEQIPIALVQAISMLVDKIVTTLQGSDPVVTPDTPAASVIVPPLVIPPAKAA